jgi:hypothetical protein
MNQGEKERLRKRLYVTLEMLDDIVNMIDLPWSDDVHAAVRAAIDEVRTVLIDTGDLLGLWQDDGEPSKW